MTTISTLYKIALGFTVIGAINWGIIGLFEHNLVTLLLGDTILSRIVYTFVGLSALYVALVQLKITNTRDSLSFRD